jgi:enoyl-CoA hydratase/carnithine racemase
MHLMNPKRVTVETTGGVADVRMTRADKHNALDAEMFRSLDAALDELRATSGLRAVVLSGDGPSFCSGLDFPSFMQNGLDIAEELFVHRDGDAANVAQRITYDWQRLPVPVIAALHGNCIGGGAQLALGPDIRIASSDVRISILEIKYGLIPDMGVSQTLPHLVGLDVAKELIFTGRIVEGAEAQRIGLVTRLADDPRAAALELAGEIAMRSPDAIRRGKRLLNEAVWAHAEESLALEESLQRELLGSPNQIAAVQAALAKQPAEFTDPEDP